MVKKKHILFIVENNSAPNDIRVWAEASAAKEFGYDVSVISPKSARAKASYENLEGIDIYRHFKPFEANGKFAFIIEYANALFWELLLSLRIFLKKPFQIIHSANPPDHVFIIALLYKVFGTKFIFDHHDICPENYLAKFCRKDLLYKILLVMEKLTFKVADIVISTNQSYKKVAIDRGGKLPEEVFVVRNGPRLSNVMFMQPNPKLKEGFDYLVAYVGVIGKEEGIDVLLRIVDYIVNTKNIQNIKFIIMGKGPNLSKMIELSEKMELGRFVKFTGFIPYKDFYEILSTADLCVNPEYANAFTDRSTMLKIMDYMTFGKPIVQFETNEGKVTAGASAAYVKDNNEIEFANKILELLSNTENRRKMGNIGKERVANLLNWDIQKPNLEKAYDYILLNSYGSLGSR